MRLGDQRYRRPHGRLVLHHFFRNAAFLNEGLRPRHRFGGEALQRHEPFIRVPPQRPQHAGQRQPAQAARAGDAHGTPILIDGYGHGKADAQYGIRQMARGHRRCIGHRARLGAAEGRFHFAPKKRMQIHKASDNRRCAGKSEQDGAGTGCAR